MLTRLELADLRYLACYLELGLGGAALYYILDVRMHHTALDDH